MGYMIINFIPYKNISMTNNIHEYLEDLVIEAGFPPEDHADLIKEIEPSFLKYLVTKLALKLPTDKVEEAELFLSKGDSDWFQDLCKKNIPSYEDYFVEILAEFEDDYLSNFKK